MAIRGEEGTPLSHQTYKMTSGQSVSLLQLILTILFICTQVLVVFLCPISHTNYYISPSPEIASALNGFLEVNSRFYDKNAIFSICICLSSFNVCESRQKHFGTPLKKDVTYFSKSLLCNTWILANCTRRPATSRRMTAQSYMHFPGS